MDLKQYIKNHKRIKVSDFAKQIGYDGHYISAILTGLRPPTPRFGFFIEHYTKGAVTYSEMKAFYEWKLEQKRRYKAEEEQHYADANKNNQQRPKKGIIAEGLQNLA
jgi:hypothetical protein